MNDTTDTFTRLRPRLQGIAYRMLGSSAEAEEVVQDAWLRWNEAEQERVDSAEAWLVAVTTRIAIDRLRSAKVQREHYIGPWMPEPTLTGSPDTPEETLARADNISVAFLAVLERLAQLYFSLWRRMGAGVHMELVELNGEPGMLRFLDGELESAQTFEIEGERIVRIRAQRNPDKLARIAQLFAAKRGG